MDYLSDIYKKHPDIVSKALRGNINVTLKIDGTAFSVVNEGDSLSYHKRSGSTSRPGPEITKYVKLFVDVYNDAVSHIESKKDIILEKYSFLSFELYNGMMFLLSAYDKNSKKIADLKKVSDELDVKTAPVIFNGRLSEETVYILEEFLKGNYIPPDFKNFIYGLFKFYSNFPKSIWQSLGDKIEGIVIEIEGGKQYKVDDPDFAVKHKEMSLRDKEKLEKSRQSMDKLFRMLYDYMSKHSKKYSKDFWESLDKNFLNIPEKDLKKMLKVSAEIPVSELKFTDSELNPEIKAGMKKYGKPYETLYWKYMYMFNSPKKRNYIIDKAFQDNVNGIIRSIKESHSSIFLNLKNFILSRLER